MNNEFKRRSAGRTDFSVWKPEVAAAMQERGFNSLADLVEALDNVLQDPAVAAYCPILEPGNIQAPTLSDYIHIKGASGYKKNGEISPVAELISIVLQKSYDELYPKPDESMPRGNEMVRFDDIQDSVDDAEDFVVEQQRKDALTRGVSSLSERHRDAIIGYDLDGLTLDNLGEQVTGTSSSRAGQILARGHLELWKATRQGLGRGAYNSLRYDLS